MTASHRSYFLAIAIAALALLLSGCASTKPQSFAMSFLPTAPAPVATIIDEPPPLTANHYQNATPNLIERVLATPPRPPEVDSRIMRAEDYLEAGKKLYQQGDRIAARREFDAAVDVLLSAPENLPDRQRLERKLDQIVDRIYRYDLEGLGSGEAQHEVVYDKSPLEDVLEMTFPTDPNLRPKVKEELAATVSQLPLQENDAVLSYIHYLSTDRGRRTLIAGLRRAGRYRPLIQRILDEEGVPQELIYLAQVESGFLPRARSYKKAVGMWQFVQFRGREYGLDQTPVSDDRLDPEKATRAAARHLRDLYGTFGDWYLAMAAYNCGPGCVDRAVQRTGFADYWDLRSLNALPRDTANYVPLILAITIMVKNPKDYGLENLDADQPIEYDAVDIDSPTNLALVADVTDRPVSEIQDLNPALLKPVAPAGYQLRVPKGTLAPVQTALQSIPASHRCSWRVHRVARGETLAEIARRYATPAGSIAAVNNRMAELPEAGDLLIIPAAYQPQRAVVHTAKASTHRKASHRVVASRQVPAKVLHHRASARTYRTAGIASKRRPAAN